MFGFLKEKLRQTVERFTKRVDEATEVVEPSEKVKKELLKEKKKPVIKKPLSKRVIDEKYGLEISEKGVRGQWPGERRQKREEVKKEEKKGFFAKLKEKFIHKEERGQKREGRGQEAEERRKKIEEKKEELFQASAEELKELEDSFKKVEHPIAEEEKKEELIPVVTETKAGETVFEMQEKPTAVKKKKKEEEKKGEEKKEAPVLEIKEDKGFFGALKETLFKTSLSEEKFEEIFWELEVILLENNVAVEVIELIKKNLKKELVETKVLRGELHDIITGSLRESIEETFTVEPLDIISRAKEKKPFVIVFVGINGSGKTTTIAKIAHLLKENALSCVIAAGDTFRAAAIQQLEEHANNLHVKLIKHDYGSDPAAVGFDAIKYAKAHNIDCVLIDTAGRLHSNINLIDEMKKIIRVTKPDLKLFIGEAITGNDCVEQARRFNEAIGIDGIILAKADVDEKGGAALSVSYVTGKPILYLGVGQGYNDLEAFNSEMIIGQLGLA